MVAVNGCGTPWFSVKRMALVTALVLLVVGTGCTSSGDEMAIANETDHVILVSVGEDRDPVRVEAGATSAVLPLPDGCARDRSLRVGVVARTEDGEILARDTAPCGVPHPRWVFHPDGTAEFESSAADVRLGSLIG